MVSASLPCHRYRYHQKQRLGDSMTDRNQFGRRALLGGAAMLSTGLGATTARAQSAARKSTLVIGLDISDAISLDPARVAQYSNPLPAHNAYDSLVTFSPGDYINLKPSLATEWACPTARRSASSCARG